MTFNIAAARELIATAELPRIEALAVDAADAAAPLPEFDTIKQQALVVASDVVSFTSGVEADFRQAIADSALFAQLAADKSVGPGADPIAFFDAYFTNLVGLGWMIQRRETAEVTYKGDGFDVHEAVIGVITSFLAPIAGAAAAVVAVLQGLKSMNQNAPFITLFNEQSSHGELGRFQFTYVHNDPDHGLMAEAMAFALKADQTVTQVLFFRLHKGSTSLRRSTGSLSIDTAALQALRPVLGAKMNAYRAAFIASADLGAPGGS